jgi:hypothetical protein
MYSRQVIGVEVLPPGALQEVHIPSVIDISSDENPVAGGVCGMKADQDALLGTRLEMT